MRFRFLLFLAAALPALAQPQFDLLLKGGRVIDPKNSIDRVMDVAVAGGKIARVAADIPAAQARVVANVAGLIVTPGLVDIHEHVFAGPTQRVFAGDQSVWADSFSFRSGVTTVADAGTSGWHNFPDFRDRVIRRSATRIFAFLNICGMGMGQGENNPDDCDVAEAVKMAKANPEIIVGFKAAHWARPNFQAEENAVEAGKQTGLPVMVDFGEIVGPRNLQTLLLERLRPGDIYTHTYSGARHEQDNGKVNAAMIEGRKRGVIFDLGHGATSFNWNVAVPAFEQHFWPDSISTDLHTQNMNAGVKDVPTVMSKVLSLGVPLPEVIRMITVNSAREIHHPELGSLDVGAVADIAVLALERGQFGFLDSSGARRDSDQKLRAEMTVKGGAVVWDLNGRAATDWKSYRYRNLR